MSRVIFMCGPAGSGKSRFASLLAERGFTVLSIDVEAWQRGFRHMPIPDAAAEGIRDALRERLFEIVDAGGDVVLDFAFWSRRMRDEWRAVLAPGVTPELVYVRVDRETACARATQRKPGPDSFVLSREITEQYFDGFEPPQPDEHALTVDGTGPFSADLL